MSDPSGFVWEAILAARKRTGRASASLACWYRLARCPEFLIRRSSRRRRGGCRSISRDG